MKLSKLQKFKPRKIRRSQIKNALYNPRRIKTQNRAKLNKSLDEFGLVETLIWNRKTGHLVGGHRRLEHLDAAENGGDFWLDVAEIEIDEAREKALNVVLNNAEAQGAFDNNLLSKLLTELEQSVRPLTGFNAPKIAKLINAPKVERVRISAIFEVIIQCENEKAQKKVFEKLQKEGLKCRVLTL